MVLRFDFLVGKPATSHKLTMIHFIFLNEFTLLRAVVLAMLNRPVYLIKTKPVFGFLASALDHMARYMKKRLNVQCVFKVLPNSRLYWDMPGYSNHTNIFAKVESGINQHFRFDQVDWQLGSYAMPFKHEACKYMSEKFNDVFLIRDIAKKFSANEATIITTDEDVLFLYEQYYQERPRPLTIRVHQFRKLVNFGFLGVTLIVSLAWTLAKLRWLKSDQQSFLLGADFTGGQKQVDMVREIIGDPARCLFVFRNASQRKNHSADIIGFSHCLNDNGVLTLFELPSIIALIVREGMNLYFHQSHLAPDYFSRLLKLPYKRVAYRTLLNRFQFKFFWCRDDYNSDHILRSQELRRNGSMSLGINHGLPSPNTIEPVWRYIDYDTYYVFGIHVHQSNHTGTWSDKMHVKPVGSLCMTRNFLERINQPRPADIIYYAPVSRYEQKMREAIFEVAKAFPKKKVYIKIKPSLNQKSFSRKFVEQCRSGPKNLVVTEADSYELMFMAQYVLSAGSTISAEAIQFGLNVFVFDFGDQNEPFYYRDFPGLCVTSASESIARISDIDIGKEVYPRQSFDKLIKLSGPYIIDVIRNDLGLEPTIQDQNTREPEQTYANQ